MIKDTVVEGDRWLMAAIILLLRYPCKALILKYWYQEQIDTLQGNIKSCCLDVSCKVDRGVCKVYGICVRFSLQGNMAVF